ncbi:unnamed protein product [Pocillopora meandrina]|uniref:MD-2-related lipid-recognition domain-containing protein n=1 Tax=Pocillopora meandrina TaxID=46732 RepID=A0AAU9XC47_9CNID|nr:unnamed protein product [Pocillopora meandrina]
MMILTQQPGQTIFLSMFVFVISGTWGYRSGIEMINVTFCGKYDKPPTLKVSPWPFIPAGNHFIVNMTFTPAVDVLEASMQYEVVLDGKVILRSRDDTICNVDPPFCNLPAGETKVWVRTGKLPPIPPVFKVIDQLA